MLAVPSKSPNRISAPLLLWLDGLVRGLEQEELDRDLGVDVDLAHERPDAAPDGSFDDRDEVRRHRLPEGSAGGDDLFDAAGIDQRPLSRREDVLQQAEDVVVMDVGLGPGRTPPEHARVQLHDLAGDLGRARPSLGAPRVGLEGSGSISWVHTAPDAVGVSASAEDRGTDRQSLPFKEPFASASSCRDLGDLAPNRRGRDCAWHVPSRRRGTQAFPAYSCIETLYSWTHCGRASVRATLDGSAC